MDDRYDYDTQHDDLADAPSTSADATALTASLMEWFGKHKGMRCLLAVDPSQRDLMADFADSDTAFAALPRADVIVAHDAFAQSHRPYLLEMDLSTQAGASALSHSVQAAFDDRQPDSMASGLGQRIGGWLASPASLEEVAMHWSDLVLQRDASGRACVLRFYDMRALDLLWPVLSQAQRQALLGPVRAWHTLDASARPVVRECPPAATPRFVLSPAQWSAIHRHGLVNRALALHAYEHTRQPQAAEVEAALAAAARAERYGLTDRDDQIAFIGHAIAWHPQFDLHPKVLQLLGRRDGDDFYTADIGQLSKDDVDEIRRGTWYERLVASPPR